MLKTNDIEFRSKLSKQVKFSSVEEAIVFKDLFVEILNHSEEFIIGLLWSLSYDPAGKASPEKYLVYLEKLSRFTDKQRTVIGNEIRHQFAKAHPEFLDVAEKYWPEYQSLVSSSNEVTAYVVLQRCKDLGSSLQEFVAQEIRHLSLSLDGEVDSNAEDGDKQPTNREKVHKALTYLNFNPEAATFLLNYAQKIAALLEAVTVSSVKPTNETLKQQETQSQTSSDNTPKQEEQSTGPELVEHNTAITAEGVIAHRAELVNFFQAFDNLEAHGVHPLEVIQFYSDIVNFKKAMSSINDFGVDSKSILDARAKIDDLFKAL